MTKIEQTLALAVVAIKARRVQVSDPTQLSALPSNAELDDLREWVTAALPVVEAVRELQKVAKAAANQNSTLASRAEARKRMPAIVADLLAVVVPGNEP